MSSSDLGLFGVPTNFANAGIVIVPVPWEVTTSYGGGTSRGPLSILNASSQVDLFDRDLGNTYEKGYHLLPIPESIQSLNDKLKPLALALRKTLEAEKALSSSQQKHLAEINTGCATMVDWVYSETRKILAHGKIPAGLGGDHSSPEGVIRAVSEHHKGAIGLLHFDAHADLRKAYQGFSRSHASIMFNVMDAPWRPAKLVQVGIRDFSAEENALIQARSDIHTFFDSDLKTQLFEGRTWADITKTILTELPKQVYVSFDIDALSPDFCPNTGTPVPGGLSFDQAVYVLKALAQSGRKIVGFDLNEVAVGSDPDNEWDANVGARLLYKMCGWSVLSGS